MGRKEMRAEVVQTKQARIGTDLQLGIHIRKLMAGSPSCDPLRVLQGVLDADVPVQGDEAQVEDGGGGAHHVRAEQNSLKVSFPEIII